MPTDEPHRRFRLCGVDEFEQVSGSNYLEHAEEAFGELVVLGGDRAIDLKMAKHALDTIAHPCSGCGRG